jgi:hypothetical protein
MAAEQMKYLQPPALIAELGPAPEPGLAGALNFLAGHRQCVLEPALSVATSISSPPVTHGLLVLFFDLLVFRSSSMVVRGV